MKTLEEIRDFFAGDRFATCQGMMIDSVDKETAVCSVELCKDHYNAVGIPQGGIIFTLADFAFAVAVNNMEPSTVTLNSTINYLRSPKGHKLIATAVCSGRSKNISFYQINICDDLGYLIAQVSTTGYTKTGRL